MKQALIFSALGWNTGCALRARYLACALKRLGWKAELVLPPFPSLPLSLEVFLSAPWFAALALFKRADLAVGIKPYPNCWLALFILRLKGARAVADVDDLDSAYRGGLVGLFSRLSQAPAFRLLKEFSTHHRAIRLRLARYGGHVRVFELGQGVDTSIFHPRKGKPGKVLLFAAHLNVACQLELLMDWLAPLLSRHPDFKLVVAGGGPKLREYRSRYRSSQVAFRGQLGPEAMAGEMAKARICLSAYAADPGNNYRVPMKVGEYLAMAKPVVTNLIPGLSSLAPYLYPGRGAGFRAQVERLMLGKGDGREKRGAAFMAREKSWDKTALRFLEELR